MDDRELMIRYLDGELAGEEAERTRRRLREEPELRALLERMTSLAAQARRKGEVSFEPFFSTRVMAAIRGSEAAGSESMYEALRAVFARLAVACLVVAVGIAVYSVVGGGYGGSAFETLLGLPETTLDTALTLGG